MLKTMALLFVSSVILSNLGYSHPALVTWVAFIVVTIKYMYDFIAEQLRYDNDDEDNRG